MPGYECQQQHICTFLERARKTVGVNYCLQLASQSSKHGASRSGHHKKAAGVPKSESGTGSLGLVFNQQDPKHLSPKHLSGLK